MELRINTMKKENVRLVERFSGIRFLLFWIMAHISLWGITQAISAIAKLSLHLFIANAINPFICSLQISENNFGSTCTILGLDFGLAIGQMISFLAAFLFGGVLAGLGEWQLVKASFNVSAKQRNPIIIISILVGWFTSFFVNFLAMFSGIINVAIGGIYPSIATLIVGLFFGALFGAFYGIVTLLIYSLPMIKRPAHEKLAQ